MICAICGQSIEDEAQAVRVEEDGDLKFFHLRCLEQKEQAEEEWWSDLAKSLDRHQEDLYLAGRRW